MTNRLTSAVLASLILGALILSGCSKPAAPVPPPPPESGVKVDTAPASGGTATLGKE